MSNRQQTNVLDKKVMHDNITYSISEDKKTASVIECKSTKMEIIIPRSISHEQKEYVIKTISDKAFMHSNIKSIEFEANSELRTISKNVFFGSTIESISIPASVVELEEGWCFKTTKLNHIEIDSKNPRYMCVDGKYIIGKSDMKKKEYDILIFAARNIVKANIPNTVKIIGAFSFERSQIESISIPAQVEQICEYAFLECDRLIEIGFEPNSKLRTISKNAFFCSTIESISIPASVVELEEGWCFMTARLNHIEVDSKNPRYMCVDGKYIIGKSDIKKKNYDTLVFAVRNIIKANIPSTVKIIGGFSFERTQIGSISIPAQVTQIGKSAFSFCKNLNHIEFHPKSELRTIEKGAFEYSCIENFSIPSRVTTIGENAFSSCYKLVKFEIPPKSELKTIEKKAFQFSGIWSISIPSHVTQIGENAFSDCLQLVKVEFPIKSKLKVIESETFKNSPIQFISIPASVIELKKGWCSYTSYLKYVSVDQRNPRYFDIDKKLIIGKSDIKQKDYDTLVFSARDIFKIQIPCRIIEAYSFCCSRIQKLVIPSFVTKICEGAFQSCHHLVRVEFQQNSKLQVIEKEAFTYSYITSFSIPQQVTQIDDEAFRNCFNLQIVEIDENSASKSIKKQSFGKNAIIMIPVQKKNILI